MRLIGDDMDQMEVAARHAAGLGLETWINPYPYEATLDEARALLADPRLDLDMASWGIVKVFEDPRGDTYPDMTWEPKEAFGVLAEYYRS